MIFLSTSAYTLRCALNNRRTCWFRGYLVIYYLLIYNLFDFFFLFFLDEHYSLSVGYFSDMRFVNNVVENKLDLNER